MVACKPWAWGIIAGLTAVAVWLVQAAAEMQVGRGFQPGDAVQTIRVELAVGAGGEDLDEPIALDLGLGFPLWLHRLGRVDSAVAPFGAVSQRGISAHLIRAGERATFEFSASGDPGLDDLRTTAQLLAGVRIGDISRIGFTSKGDKGWILAAYQIHINGKLLAANDAVNANGRGLQDAARERLTELNRELNPRQTELSELEAMVSAGLANEADKARLAEVRQSLAGQIAEQRRLERQLRGASPLFAESDFRPAWRANGAIEKMKVTVVTAPHSGADSSNYIYFRTGGHKYLLGSPVMSLSPDHGPQEFDLDLATTPMTAGDLRGYALGMLAHHEPSGDAPDRWHPQRLRVEVDGRVVYDSEENALDRTSLSAIRLIPPAHVKPDHTLAVNTPNPREAFVWEAGSGAGVDLVHGGAEELPPEGDPLFPAAESSLVIEQQQLVFNQETWYDPAAGPFPGEAGFGPGWQPGWGQGWFPGWHPGFDPGWGPGWTPGPSWFDLFMLDVLDQLGILPHWVIPEPIGEPPQIENVAIDYATDTIHWVVTGNEGQIDHFIVDRVLVRPDLAVPFVHVLSDPIEVAASQRSLPMASVPVTHPIMAGPDELSRMYSTIRVTIVPTDPAIGVDPAFSPAAPLMATPVGTAMHLSHEFDYTPGVGPLEHLPVALGGDPELPGAAVWPAGQIDSHSGLAFAGFSPHQYHIVARPEGNGDVLTVRFTGLLPPGTHRLIAFVGFRGGVEQHADVNVASVVHLTSVLNPALQIGYPGMVHAQADPAAAPTPLVPLLTDIHTGDVGPGPMLFTISYRFANTSVDPAHPPVVIGVRLLNL